MTSYDLTVPYQTWFKKHYHIDFIKFERHLGNITRQELIVNITRKWWCQRQTIDIHGGKCSWFAGKPLKQIQFGMVYDKFSQETEFPLSDSEQKTLVKNVPVFFPHAWAKTWPLIQHWQILCCKHIVILSLTKSTQDCLHAESRPEGSCYIPARHCNFEAVLLPLMCEKKVISCLSDPKTHVE